MFGLLKGYHFKLLIILHGFLLSCNSVQVVDKFNEKVVLYKNFSLFSLQGTDTLKDEHGKKFVRVIYKNEFPVSINYVTDKDNVTLVLSDSFISSRPIYLYKTSNLFGGPPDKQYDHSFRYEENRYDLFVSLTDTLICHSYDLLDSASKSYPYSLDIFIKKNKDSLLSLGDFGHGDLRDQDSMATRYQKFHKKIVAVFLENMSQATYSRKLVPYP